MKKRNKNHAWEKTIDKLLKENNPCKVCLVKMTCAKSFTDGTACEDLAKKLTEAMEQLKRNT